MRDCSVTSAAKSAASLADGLDPEDCARIATRWSFSATCSLNFARLRLPQGGDQPNPTTIDNDIASHGITATTPFAITETHRTIHAELSVRFPPFQLYEFPVMRTEALAWQAEALIIISATGSLPRFLEFQEQHGTPVLVDAIEQVEAGGLLSYGPSYAGMGRLAAVYVEKILKGARPADLPVQQPIEYELCLNRTTAMRLGIDVPPDVAAQVTQWVQ